MAKPIRAEFGGRCRKAMLGSRSVKQTATRFDRSQQSKSNRKDNRMGFGRDKQTDRDRDRLQRQRDRDRLTETD